MGSGTPVEGAVVGMVKLVWELTPGAEAPVGRDEVVYAVLGGDLVAVSLGPGVPVFTNIVHDLLVGPFLHVSAESAVPGVPP